MSERPVIFGVPVDPLTMDETVARCEELIESRCFAQHVVINAGKVVAMSEDAGLRSIVAACALCNADGQSIVWAGRSLGIPFPERVAGVDLFARLLELAQERRWPVYFLGATQATLDSLLETVASNYPGLPIAGARNGYFEDDVAVARGIQTSGARLLFVGMSSPRKEYFLADNAEELGPCFCMGVGGSFDVLAGRTRRAPQWMQHIGMEWAFRFMQEPRRMWRRYLVGNARFMRLWLRELLQVYRRGAGAR